MLRRITPVNSALLSKDHAKRTNRQIRNGEALRCKGIGSSLRITHRIEMVALTSSIDWDRWLFVAVASVLLAGTGVMALFPVAMFRREAVKRYLLERGCQPRRVRWLVFTWWCPGSPKGLLPWIAMPFRVVYSDPNGFIHRANCWVGHEVFDSLFSPRRICWVKDEVVGEKSKGEFTN